MQQDIEADIAAIGRIPAVKSILEVVCRTTGMGFAAVARVTEDRWIACDVRDEISFGLKPGGELKIETTICNEIRQTGNSVAIDPSVGGAFIVRAPDGSLHISGEVFECDPPRKLTVTFNVNWPALIEKLGPTLVSYVVEPAGNAVKLTMTESHDRPIDDDILSGGRQGWPAILSGLKSLLETGVALEVKMAPPQRMLEALKRLGIGTRQLRVAVKPEITRRKCLRNSGTGL